MTTSCKGSRAFSAANDDESLLHHLAAAAELGRKILQLGQTVLPMRDGLPKLKDFPAEFGGSGEMMPE